MSKSAEDVRRLMPKTPKAVVEDITEMCAKHAKKGKTSMKVRFYGFGDSKVYAGELTDNQKEVMKELRELGYKTRIGSTVKQFVDVWLEVSWEED